MNKKIISDFLKMIDVNTPIIYINDYDFVRIDEIIVEIVGNSKVIEWNPATGTTNFKTKESKAWERMIHWSNSCVINILLMSI